MEVRGHGVRQKGKVPLGEHVLAHEEPEPVKRPAKKHDAKASITARPVRPASASAATRATVTMAAAGKTAPPVRRSSVEFSLVENLKTQIAFLEAQVICLKRQREMPGAARGAGARGRSPHRASSSASLTVVPEDRGSGGLAAVPEAYQAEMVALQLNLERAMEDCDGMRDSCRHLNEEKCVMGSEIAELKTALRSAEDDKATCEAELKAAKAALLAEQASRRLLEDSVAERASSSTSSTAAGQKQPELLDVVHQKEFFRLRFERATAELQLLQARAAAQEENIKVERATSQSLESQLCAALDQVAEMESQNARQREFYTRLGSRFVTTSATLRKVLETAKHSTDEKSIAVLHEVNARANGDVVAGTASEDVKAFETLVREKLPDVQEPPTEVMQQVNEEETNTKKVSPPELPAPPSAAVPSPPSATVVTPPPADKPANRTPPPPTGPLTELQQELVQLEMEIASEEASLAAFVQEKGK